MTRTLFLSGTENPLAGLAPKMDMVSKLHQLSEGGEPLLVRLYVEALHGTGEHAAFLTPEKLEHLKPGLEAYFDQWWDDQRRQWGASVPLKEPAVRTLLNLMACALGPLSIEDLLALMQPEIDSRWLLEEALQPLARFVVGNGQEQGYVFSHPRLSRYFYEKLPRRERQAWEHCFMNYGRQMLAALTSGKYDPCELSSYLVRFYGTHLERGDAHPDLFHELVSEGWLGAWEALEGTYNGFLRDLTRAWKRAEVSGTQGQNTEARSRDIGLQCRYALIAASINSLTRNIHPALLVALVDKGVWTPVQGLKYARQVSDEWQQALALARLTPHLPPSLQMAAFQEALTATRTINRKYRRAEVLGELAPHLPIPLLQEALAVARAIESVYPQAKALAGLAPHLPMPLLEEALAIGRTVEEVEARTEVLTELAPYLPPPLQIPVLQEALATARAINREHSRAEALVRLAPHLPMPLLEEALVAARAINRVNVRARALAGLAPHLPPSLQTIVLQEALVAARAINRVNVRARALAGLAPHLPPSLQTIVLQEALAAARAINHEYSRVTMLAELAPHLPPSLQTTVLEEALAAVRAINPEHRRVEMLVGLTPHLPVPLLEEALAIGQTIENVDERIEALTALVPHLPIPLLQEALTASRVVADADAQAKALVELAPHLSSPLLQETLAVALAVVDTYARAMALKELVPYLSSPLQETAIQEALAAAQQTIEKKSSHMDAVSNRRSALLMRKQGIAAEDMELKRILDREKQQADMLMSLSSHPPMSQSQEVIMRVVPVVARIINDADDRAKNLAELIPHMKQLPIAALYSLWCEALRVLATRTRRDLLSDVQALAPVIEALGGKEALVATAQAIIEVRKWFP